MAYSSFGSLAALGEKLSLEQTLMPLFKGVKLPSVRASQRLRQDIEDASRMSLMSEKAKSEFLIAPVIREIQRRNGQISCFSGVSFNVASELDLVGTPDFIIAAKPRLVDVEAPVFCLMETKNQAIEEGYAQCAAEMYAARLYNRQNSEPFDTVYGAVTNAYEWVFMKLEAEVVYVDTQRYYLNNLNQLLGIIQWIIHTAVDEVTTPV